MNSHPGPEPTAVRTFQVVDLDEVAPNRRRGGDLRTLLSPANVGATSGFMGVAILGPDERITEHFHPYSEEFVYAIEGAITIDLDGTPYPLRAGQGVLVPPLVRHRLRNTGGVESRLVFHLSPLAPRPDLGHVDTEGLT